MAFVQSFIDLTNLKGLNNKVDASQINPKQVVEAVNIDLDDAGLPSRRKGYSHLTLYGIADNAQGNIHSGWGNGDWVYFVRGAFLCFYNVTTTVLTPILSLSNSELNNKWSYTQLPDGRIFAVNGVHIGYLQADSWTDLESPKGSYKIPLKSGHLCRYYNGRVYVASGNIIWFSDPFSYGQMDSRYNFLQMHGYIRLLEPNSNGIYCADGTTWFIRGSDPYEFALTLVTNYNAILGTSTIIDGTLWFEGNQLNGTNIIWMSEQGLCIGVEEGKVYNITNKKYVTPSSKIGASVYRTTDNNINQTITVLQN